MQPRQQEERVREAEHHLAGQRSEADLCRRRLEESRVQLSELQERDLREEPTGRRAGHSVARQSKRPWRGRESELEEARRVRCVSCSRVWKPCAGRWRALEEKKGQAVLVEVKLRERCRTLAGERARVEGQKDVADREVGKCERRVEFLERCAPVVASLLAVAEGSGRTGQGRQSSAWRAMWRPRATRPRAPPRACATGAAPRSGFSGSTTP